MSGSHSCRWCCPHGWNFQDHRQPLWRHNASIPESGPWERFICVYHGTVWSLHQVPQRWKWQSLNILVVVHRHDLELIWATREGDWMIHLASVRVMIPMLLRRDISAANNPPRCSCLIHARRDFSSAWLLQPLRKNPCRSNVRRNDEQGHTYARETKGFSLKPCAVRTY